MSRFTVERAVHALVLRLAIQEIDAKWYQCVFTVATGF